MKYITNITGVQTKIIQLATMLLIINGNKSIFKNTKNINVIYFFVKDVINRR